MGLGVRKGRRRGGLEVIKLCFRMACRYCALLAPCPEFLEFHFFFISTSCCFHAAVACARPLFHTDDPFRFCGHLKRTQRKACLAESWDFTDFMSLLMELWHSLLCPHIKKVKKKEKEKYSLPPLIPVPRVAQCVTPIGTHILSSLPVPMPSYIHPIHLHTYTTFSPFYFYPHLRTFFHCF